MKNRIYNQKQPSNFLEDITYKYIPFWPLFVCLMLIFFAIGWAYLRYSTPMYEATATILIKDEKKGAEETNMSESFNIISSKKIVENEIVVIQSRDLVEQVVKDLHLYTEVYERGKVKSNIAYNTAPVIVTSPDPDSLIPTEENVHFKYDEAIQRVIIGNTRYALDTAVVTPYGKLVFTQNPNLKATAEKELSFSITDPKEVTTALQKKLEVAPAGKLSSIVKLSLKDEVPERGEHILNKLIDIYNTSSLDYKNTLAKNTIDFVDRRMRIVQQELTGVEKQIQNYKTQQGIVDLSEQGRLYLQHVGENDQKLSQINMQLAVLNQVEQYVSSKNKSTGIVPSTLGVNDPVLSGLLDKLYQAELDYERLKKTTAENNPVMETVVTQIERIRPGILENINNQRSGLVASRNNLTSTNRAYSSILQTLPQKERQLIDVSREQTIKNNIYSYLLQKREETAITYASNIADSKLVETAHAGILPVSPKKAVVYGVAIMLALMFSFLYVMFKEIFSRKILFRNEIEDYTDIPIVAELSYFPQLKKDITGTNGVMQEQFRQLRAATGLFSKINQKKKILVTSSIPGEGKSLVSSNLAINLAHSGKKVVLVDTDLRNPQVAEKFKIVNNLGIAEYLEGEIEPLEIIKSTPVKNLHIIPAGAAVLNATEIILNEKLEHLIEYLEESFDYIIMDCSPVNPIADAYILSEYCDLTLYIIRHGETPKTCIKNLDETNKIKGLKNLAIIFNGIKPRGFIKGNLGYGYGYGYEYSYENHKQRFFNSMNLRKSFRQFLDGSKIKMKENQSH